MLRGGQQHLGRVAFGDDLVHGDAWRRADLGDRGAQGLGRQLGIVGVVKRRRGWPAEAATDGWESQVMTASIVLPLS